MDLAFASHERIMQVCSSPKIKAGERIIAQRTNFNYHFEDKGDKVHIWGKKSDGSLTSVIVKL